MTDVKTDCRSYDGITVGLIDTMINCARLLKGRDMMPSAVQEAMRDLRHDEDVERLIIHADIDIRDRMRAEIARLSRPKKPEYPVIHRNPNIQGLVIQYDSNVFVWHTMPTETRKAEQRIASSLKKAWAHRASHLRCVKGVI